MAKPLHGPVLVRPACDDDWPGLWPLLREMGQTGAEAAVRQRVARTIRASDHCLLVALVSSSAVGYAWAQDYGPHLRSGQSTLRLNDLFVAATWRRRGVGRRLFDAVTAWAAEQGATWLQWQSSRDAVPFYERLGLTGDPCPDLDHPFFEIKFPRI